MYCVAFSVARKNRTSTSRRVLSGSTSLVPVYDELIYVTNTKLVIDRHAFLFGVEAAAFDPFNPHLRQFKVPEGADDRVDLA